MSLVVQTSYGPVEGFVDTRPLSSHSTAGKPPGTHAPVRKWLGVPYAQALRLERCKPPAQWTATRECKEFGPAFPQKSNMVEAWFGETKGWVNRSWLGFSEDAFTVNVFAPEEEGGKLPVMVWVYGGGLDSGAANMPIYDPTEFVRAAAADGNPCIVVTGNYRVNAFGFMATEDLTKVNGHVGNLGLHDVIAYLEWVQANISAFGGDAKNVTIFGESAGAFIVGTLLTSKRRLFNKAIMESGSYGLLLPQRKLDFPGYDKLLQNLHLDGPELTAEDRVKALRELSTEEFLDATHAVYLPESWQPRYDPDEEGLQGPVWNLIANGDYDPWIESVIMGINEDEGSVFNMHVKFWIRENALNRIQRRHGIDDETGNRVLDMYPPDEPNQDNSNLRTLPSSTFISDYMYLTPLKHAAEKIATVPNKVTGKTIPFYAYYCRTVPSELKRVLGVFGNMHAGELPFVFNMRSLWGYDKDSADEQTSNLFTKCWSSFAKTGSPGNDWPAFDMKTSAMLVLDDGGRTSIGNLFELRKKETQLWTEVLNKRMEEM